MVSGQRRAQLSVRVDDGRDRSDLRRLRRGKGGGVVMAKKTNAKHTAESELLLKLQNAHGYMLHDVPKSKRTTLVFSTNPKGKKTIAAFRVVQLVVPMDSALAVALDKNDKRSKESA
jgi:microcystin degradation protein MlrC